MQIFTSILLVKVVLVLLVATFARLVQGQVLESYITTSSERQTDSRGIPNNTLSQSTLDNHLQVGLLPTDHDEFNETEGQEVEDCNPWLPVGAPGSCNLEIVVLNFTAPNSSKGDTQDELAPLEDNVTSIIPTATIPTRECVIQDRSNAEGSLLHTVIAANVSECCAQCRGMSGCNTFVYCPNPNGCEQINLKQKVRHPYQACDLKQQIAISFGANPVYYFRGEETDFVSGFIEDENIGVPISQEACAVYETAGPQQVIVDQGLNMVAPNGDKFLRVQTARDCVVACEAVTRKCNQPCCDSVTFNPQAGKCFLKVKGVKGETETNEHGWQSFWRVEQLPVEAESDLTPVGSITICPEDVQHKEYSDAYVSLGLGQIAISEGSILQMQDGSYTKRFTSLVECALECQKLIECDALTYSAESFTCLLRTGSQKFSTISSQFGETTYWRIPESRANDLCQQKGWYCLYCGGDYGDACEYF